MIIIDDKIVSDDLLDQDFVCNLTACKGACCVEGDGGAPLEEDELDILEKEYANFEAYLTEEGKSAIAEQSFYTKGEEGFATPLVEGKACAYVTFAADGTTKCGIEKAFEAGKTSFRKPLSCHLYPVRIKKYSDFEAVNYSRWDICSAACALGKELQVPVYKFLKDALIRKYGLEFWEILDGAAQHQQEQQEQQKQ